VGGVGTALPIFGMAMVKDQGRVEAIFGSALLVRVSVSLFRSSTVQRHGGTLGHLRQTATSRSRLIPALSTKRLSTRISHDLGVASAVVILLSRSSSVPKMTTGDRAWLCATVARR
jgi:hypothetical protein